MCISKMSRGGGGVYLEGDFDGEEKLIRWLDREIVEGGNAVGERVRRRKKERRGGREARLNRSVPRRAPALVAPCCVPRAPARVASYRPPWHGRLTTCAP
jgi:hypothetical protein